MADIGILVCKELKCEAELGKAITIKVSGIMRKAGIWDIEKIRLVSGQWNDAFSFRLQFIGYAEVDQYY